MQWGYCKRGDGRYRTWVEGVVMVGGKHSLDPPCAPHLWGQSPALGDPPCAPRALGQNLEWPRPNQLIWSWLQQALPVCQHFLQCQCSPCSSSSLKGGPCLVGVWDPSRARRVGSSGRVASVPPPTPSPSRKDRIRGGQIPFMPFLVVIIVLSVCSST